MKGNGFTLIEIVVVVALLGTITLIGSSLLFTLIKGSLKAKVTSEIKQNGNYALSTMERMIRNSKGVESCTFGSLEIKNQDDDSTIFSCEADKISSNSSALTSLKVKPSACSFSCNLGTSGINPDVVTIDFTLTQSQETSRLEERATVQFKTTVSLRNY